MNRFISLLPCTYYYQHFYNFVRGLFDESVFQPFPTSLLYDERRFPSNFVEQSKGGRGFLDSPSFSLFHLQSVSVWSFLSFPSFSPLSPSRPSLCSLRLTSFHCLGPSSFTSVLVPFPIKKVSSSDTLYWLKKRKNPLEL